MVEMTKMAGGLFQKINAFYGTLSDENAKAQFRADYTKLAETRFGLPPSRIDTNSSRLLPPGVWDLRRSMRKLSLRQNEPLLSHPKKHGLKQTGLTRCYCLDENRSTRPVLS